MTTQTKRQKIRVGDLALVAGAGFGELPLYRITDLELDEGGNVTVFYLTASSNLKQEGAAVPAVRVIGVFRNLLNED